MACLAVIGPCARILDCPERGIHCQEVHTLPSQRQSQPAVVDLAGRVRTLEAEATVEEVAAAEDAMARSVRIQDRCHGPHTQRTLSGSTSPLRTLPRTPDHSQGTGARRRMDKNRTIAHKGEQFAMALPSRRARSRCGGGTGTKSRDELFREAVIKIPGNPSGGVLAAAKYSYALSVRPYSTARHDDARGS